MRAWAEINAQALSHNITQLQRQAYPARLMAVVKADAYGHGMDLVAPLAAAQGVADFGVATVAEGIALRALLPQVRIFVIALTLPAEAEALVAHHLTPFLSDYALGAALAAAASCQGVTAEAHLEVDTGIGRAGVSANAACGLLQELAELRSLQVTGLATHFASADEDPADADTQNELFAGLLAKLAPLGVSLTVHAANSPATLVLPDARYQMIRPGLLLYGIAPAPGLFVRFDLPLRPVLSLKSRVLLCRRLPAGASISYGRTYVVPPRGGTYATLGIGYGDGFPRRLSNQGHVLLHGQRAPICGRVCMDQLVIDVTDIPHTREGDVATLLGTDGGEEITVSSLAAQIDTTPHEITTCLTSRIPRVLVDP